MWEESRRGRRGDGKVDEVWDMVVRVMNEKGVVVLCWRDDVVRGGVGEVVDEDGEVVGLMVVVVVGGEVGVEVDKLVEGGYVGLVRKVVWEMVGWVGGGGV